MTGRISLASVTSSLAGHVPLYGWHPPVYQTTMLAGLEHLWTEANRRILDIGGGTGVMAQAIKDLFGPERVVSIDVDDRFLKTLTIETATFDGRRLPFPDGSFDCAVLFNVLHHVPRSARTSLMRECRRVVGAGPIYIKDHLTTGPADDVRLCILDLLGNIPFHGMLRARYLDEAEWGDLASRGGYSIKRRLSGTYRSAWFERLFPNRLRPSRRSPPTRRNSPPER